MLQVLPSIRNESQISVSQNSKSHEKGLNPFPLFVGKSGFLLYVTILGLETLTLVKYQGRTMTAVAANTKQSQHLPSVC